MNETSKITVEYIWHVYHAENLPISFQDAADIKNELAKRNCHDRVKNVLLLNWAWHTKQVMKDIFHSNNLAHWDTGIKPICP